jgi:hypothetical protein
MAVSPHFAAGAAALECGGGGVMEVVDARERRVLAGARGFVRGEAGALLFNAGLTALWAWVAVHGTGEQLGLPAAVFWVLAGVAAGDVWGAGRSVWSGWRDLRRLRRNPAYVMAVAELDDAHERVRRCARLAAARERGAK